MRVLIVDDQRRARQSMKAVLSAWRRVDEVREAVNGDEAVQLAEVFRPDVILMDVRMPKMNGLEATRLIRAKGQPIKIIALSLYPEAEGQALAAGADAFVSKSEPPERLRKTLAEVMRDMK